MHVKNKLVKASKCFHVLRLLRKEGCGQKAFDHLFNSIVLPNITYGLSEGAAAFFDNNSVFLRSLPKTQKYSETSGCTKSYWKSKTKRLLRKYTGLVIIHSILLCHKLS